VHTLELHVEGYLKKLEILTVPSQYIHSLTRFFFRNEEKFQTNSSVLNINTRNKHHFHRPVANLSCFQKGASYCGIRTFNSLPQSIINPKNEKTHFKVALKKLLNAHSFYSVDEFFTCTDDMYCCLYDCLNVSFTVIFLCVCMFMTCGNKMPTRCNRGFYCRSYCLLNMFRARLCPSSGAQEYYTVVAASAPHQTSNLKTTARNTTGSNHCITLLSS
jgi:hypothetical protein